MPISFLKNLLGSNKKEVLILSADADDRKSLRMYLEHMSWTVRAAESMTEGTRVFSKLESLDLLCISAKIGKESGIQIVRELRKERKFRQLPVLVINPFVSASDQDKIQNMLLKSAVIAPPFSTKSLSEAIVQATGNNPRGSRRQKAATV